MQHKHTFYRYLSLLCLFVALLFFFARFASPELPEPWNWIVTFAFLFLLFGPGLITVIFIFHQDRRDQWKWQRKLLVLLLAALGGMAISSLPQAILFAHDAPNNNSVIMQYGKLFLHPSLYAFWVGVAFIILLLERYVFSFKANH